MTPTTWRNIELRREYLRGWIAAITEETVAIASAIYWSWWRARDMHGEAP